MGEEEFDSTRKNFAKATDSMQGALEQESRGKAEALRMKKKLEADVGALDVSLEHANAANIETQKTIFWHVSASLTLPKMPLKRPAPCLSNRIEHAVSLNKSSQIPMNNSLR